MRLKNSPHGAAIPSSNSCLKMAILNRLSVPLKWLKPQSSSTRTKRIPIAAFDSDHSNSRLSEYRRWFFSSVTLRLFDSVVEQTAIWERGQGFPKFRYLEPLAQQSAVFCGSVVTRLRDAYLSNS